MTATAAKIGYGVELKMLTSTGPDVWTVLGNQRDVTPPGFSVDMVDATHNSSPNVEEETIPGIKRTSDISFSIEYNPVGATTALIEGAARELKTFRSVFPTGAYIQFSGYITEFAPEAPTEDKMTASITIKRSGPYTPTAASAPTNAALPAVSGVAQVGQTLTAWEGIWASEPTTFTYVWKADGVAINGATARTYSPVIGDIGDPITVTITGTNSAGSASATSSATADVIAA